MYVYTQTWVYLYMIYNIYVVCTLYTSIIYVNVYILIDSYTNINIITTIITSSEITGLLNDTQSVTGFVKYM